jgi:hypothetical protein
MNVVESRRFAVEICWEIVKIVVVSRYHGAAIYRVTVMSGVESRCRGVEIYLFWVRAYLR